MMVMYSLSALETVGSCWTPCWRQISLFPEYPEADGKLLDYQAECLPSQEAMQNAFNVLLNLSFLEPYKVMQCGKNAMLRPQEGPDH